MHDEAGAIAALLQEIVVVTHAAGIDAEVVVVDDGSTDGGFAQVEEAALAHGSIAGIRLRRRCGKSTALRAGIEAASGDIIVMLDADGQDDPKEIPALLRALEGGADFVNGWRKKRRDGPLKRLASA